MKVLVEKMSRNSNSYRTPLTELDEMPLFPKIGKPLLLKSSSHESGGIYTSNVKNINHKGNIVIVTTMNSTYLVTIC